MEEEKIITRTKRKLEDAPTMDSSYDYNNEEADVNEYCITFKEEPEFSIDDISSTGTETGIQKRRKYEQNKKWTDEEVEKLLDYMEQNKRIEFPTARTYYSKLIELSGMDTTWKLLRCKMRNLKVSFQKADAWLQTIDAKELEAFQGIEAVKRKLSRSCAFYDRLKQFFGNDAKRIEQIDEKAYNSEKKLSFAEIHEHIDMDNFVGARNEQRHQHRQSYSSSQQTSSAASASVAEDEDSNANQSVLAEQDEMPTVKPRKTRLKFAPPKTSLEQLARMGLERTSLQKLKIECDQQRFERELALQERRLKLDEEKFKAEQKWRKQEYELKKLSFEADERIAKYEIDMKYKMNNS